MDMPATARAALAVALRRAKRAADLQQQAVRELARAHDAPRVVGHVRARGQGEVERAIDLVRFAAREHDDIDVVVLTNHPTTAPPVRGAGGQQ